MKRNLFGTDGIRGRANIFPVTAEIAMKVGMAAGRIFTCGEYRHRVVIGKDTRLSGYMIESALSQSLVCKFSLKVYSNSYKSNHITPVTYQISASYR